MTKTCHPGLEHKCSSPVKQSALPKITQPTLHLKEDHHDDSKLMMQPSEHVKPATAKKPHMATTLFERIKGDMAWFKDKL